MNDTYETVIRTWEEMDDRTAADRARGFLNKMEAELGRSGIDRIEIKVVANQRRRND